jgi:hypothetical protein
VKDLLDTSVKTHPACPECGIDLRPFLGSDGKKTFDSKFRLSSNQKKPPIKSMEKHLEIKVTSNPRHQQNPQPKPTTANPQPKPTTANPQPSHITSVLVDDSASKRDKSNPSPDRGCKYYFGYLSRRGKENEIPNICVECPRSLDCMLSNFKSKDKIKEIKKWYSDD